MKAVILTEPQLKALLRGATYGASLALQKDVELGDEFFEALRMLMLAQRTELGTTAPVSDPCWDVGPTGSACALPNGHAGRHETRSGLVSWGDRQEEICSNSCDLPKGHSGLHLKTVRPGSES